MNVTHRALVLPGCQRANSTSIQGGKHFVRHCQAPRQIQSMAEGWIASLAFAMDHRGPSVSLSSAAVRAVTTTLNTIAINGDAPLAVGRLEQARCVLTRSRPSYARSRARQKSS